MRNIIIKPIHLFLLGSIFFADSAAALNNQPGKTYPRVGQAAPKVQFAKAIEDLPIMPGLELAENEDFIFVFGSKRIAQTTLYGWVDIDNAYYFYQETLPQLGWVQIRPKIYQRENELLKIDASSANKNGLTYVRFEVEPF